MKHIVKRKGHKEPFEERKMYASVYAACKTLRVSDEEAELLASNVTKEVVGKIKDVTEISASALHKHVSESLKKYNEEAAYMYDTHKDLS